MRVQPLTAAYLPQTECKTKETLLGAKFRNVQAGGLLGFTAAYFGLHLEVSQLAGLLVAIGFVFTADQVMLLHYF